MDANGMTDAQRFDEAIDLLLNGPIESQWKQAVFDYTDGNITRAQLRAILR